MLFAFLALVGGIAWMVVYVAIVYRGLKDKTYGMPLPALALNIAWEFVFSFLAPGTFAPQVAINVIWFFLDLAILYTYFKYGRKEFPKWVDPKWFVPWIVVALLGGFSLQYGAVLEFPHAVVGATMEDARVVQTYCAYLTNLVIAVTFIGMLVRRNGVEGQSMTIAISKWIGTAAVTVSIYLQTGSPLLLVLGIAIFVFDAIYTVMLRKKFEEVASRDASFEAVRGAGVSLEV
ncbi:hypothetical protein LVJ94_51310 [Pendulispora rubella]|uniref:Uncharacterized protein n=1 Tax=Pendulispora rubella TaxID=2741070 RepID=A0ABZ2L4L1_9BACT